MSRETYEWLNTNVLIGDTDSRGNAWHYRADLQGDNPNHYPGGIPVDDVRRRLFNWEPVSVPVYARVPASRDEADEPGVSYDIHIDENGCPYRDYYRMVERPGRQNITASDDYDCDFGMFKPGYVIHGFNEWLVGNVANLIDGDVHISSAGLLKGRAVAWVEIALSGIHTVSDFPFRPHLLACTSLDGSLATTYGRKVQAVVCDNTLAIAQEEKGQQYKVKHSKYSRLKLSDARDALGLIIATADDFSQEVERLVNWKISDLQFRQVLDVTIPMVGPDKRPLSKMALTKAEGKRERISAMYRNDVRCAPWNGTAFGVLQTFNTWDHHERPTRGQTIRAERNMLSAVNGDVEKSDQEILNALALVAS